MTSAGDGGSGGFLSQQNTSDGRRSPLPWVLAGMAVLVALAVVLFTGRHRAAEQTGDNSQVPDAYASQLAISGVEMSEAANFAGGKVTYVDGQIANKGDKTVTGVNVTITFKNDVGEPPQQVPMALSLIRTREPYIDIEPVSAEPLKPGASHEFRLIFDHVSPSWNLQHPEIQPTRVQTR